MSVIATIAASTLAVFNANNVASVTIDRAELQSIDGQKAVYSQLVRTASRECSSSSVLGRTSPAARVRCRQNLLDGWTAQIDHPALTAMHNGEVRELLASK